MNKDTKEGITIIISFLITIFTVVFILSLYHNKVHPIFYAFSAVILVCIFFVICTSLIYFLTRLITCKRIREEKDATYYYKIASNILHRTTGPAVVFKGCNGARYFINGDLHRTDGPSQIGLCYYYGREYHIQNNYLEENDFYKEIAK